jgi:NitT/TauT family transport system ATP-binding protein
VSKLSINDVARRFPGRGPNGITEALGPVTFALDDGEFVAIVGPSGCGKSTLLRLIAGLDAPNEGRIALNKQPVTAPSPDCGMVFQQFALFPWLSVRRNIGFALKTSAASEATIDQLLNAVGLAGFADHYPSHLSGGMQQRAALARALAPGPGVLLLDEPFGALDQQTRGLMQEMLESLWRTERRTVLLVTHDIDEALYLADRVLVMSARPGRILTEFKIPFERPRQPSQRTTAIHSELKASISDVLRTEVLTSLELATDDTGN